MTTPNNIFHSLLIILLIILNSTAYTTTPLKSGTKHTSNAAIIISSSRYWFNYRHVSNALEIYNLITTHGNIPNENIILMLADDIPLNPRNPKRNTIFSGRSSDDDDGNLYRKKKGQKNHMIEIDYRGDDVTVDNFIRVLLDRHHPHTHSSKRLHLDDQTNLLIFLTGHGGDGFFKFQDVEEILTQDIRNVFIQMHELGRYNEILFVADTCQAFTLSPNDDGSGIRKDYEDEEVLKGVTTIGASLRGEDSYAHHVDVDIGLSVIDRYSYYFMNNMRRRGWMDNMESVSVKDAMVNGIDQRSLRATIGLDDTFAGRSMDLVPMCDFFCNKEKTTRAGEGFRLVMKQFDIGGPTQNVMDSAGTVVEKEKDVCASNVEGGESDFCKSITDTDITPGLHEEEEEEDHVGGYNSSDALFLVSVSLVIFAVWGSSKL